MAALALVLLVLPARLQAGGSGLNVVVVVNQNSTNSVQLGNYYCEKRQVPPQNLLRINWSGGNTDWTPADFNNCLLQPLLGMLASRRLSNQVDYVLLSMDIPYRVADGTGNGNSTTAALFYGFKTNTAPPVSGLPASCSLPENSFNSYAFSETPFSQARPNTAATNSFLAFMLTDSSLAQAKLIVERGLASDSSFPTQTVYLEQTSDGARNVRYQEFDEAIFESRVRGDSPPVWLQSDSTGFTNLLGLLTGLMNLTLPVNAFVAGGFGDSLTSFAGGLFENSGQTSLLAFLNAGAAGSYGTVVEPCNYLEKFPHPLDYFYQRRGFCLAEAYYQSLANPYQGLLVGEPLSAPFARPGVVTASSLTNGSVLSGQVPLQMTFSASAVNLPLSRADLFLDGVFLQTVTNLPPAPGNVLSVTLNGFTINYTVPTNATLGSTAVGLAAALNAQTNVTGVLAAARGDRLELESLAVAVPGSNVSLSATSAAGTAGQLTTRLRPARSTFLESTATGYLGLAASNTPAVGDWLELDITKTNGTQVSLTATNTVAGTSIGTLMQSLFNQVNAHPALQGGDGLQATDFSAYNGEYGLFLSQFTLYARSAGWPAAQLQVRLTGAPNLLTSPAGTHGLEDNLSDLRPRNHLYLTEGVANLALAFTLDTTGLPNGFHELALVAYEGSHVRTQARSAQTVQIQNGPLGANFTTLVGDSNSAVEATLQFSVSANTSAIASIELFSTGGSLGMVSNTPSALFPVAGTNLDLGLHPFYAVVTAASGQQYRTETKWIRLRGAEPAFSVWLSARPPTLSWVATAGRSYDILSASNVVSPFQFNSSLTPSNSSARWVDPGLMVGQRFYRVRTSH